ncbi:MAG: protein kinase [Eggerthellaceae bacterium]|nr:protein kinase [Eggerthellaceae bacterium]
MFCPYCGSANEDGVQYCAHCGKEVAATTAAAAPPSTGQAPSQTAPDSTLQANIHVGNAASDHLGPYQLMGELGRGAMARVWRAYDPNLDVERAIKEPFFDPNLPADVLDEMGRRFVKEGRAAAKLNHPNIVTIHTADVYDGRPAIVMELVDGTTLGDLLESGPLAPGEALSVLDQLLDAVGYAHEAGIVHRDIKPDNIFINKEGRVKLADFGIAHVESSTDTRATMVGTVLGTPGYMSPEQATGSAVDCRSDLFSVGAVGYEMLTGANPFGGGDGSDVTTLLYRIVHEPVPQLPEAASAGLPADLRPAIMAALSKDPANRPQTAADFKAMLHGTEVPTPTAYAQNQLADRVASSNSGKRWLPYAIVAALAVAVLGFVLVNALGGQGGSTQPVAGTSNSEASQATTQPATSAEGTEASSSDASAGLEEQGESSVMSSGQAEEAAQSGSYYLGVSNGKVAIYASDQATPIEVSDINVADLNADSQASIDAKELTCSSLDEARGYLSAWQSQIDYEKEQAAEAERQRQEEEERKRQEEEAARNTWYVCANDFVTLRASTSTGSTALMRISVREPIEYLGDAGSGWSHVRYNGTEGYVITKFISPDQNAPLVYDDV